MSKNNVVRIRQVKSGIGYPKDQRATLVGLGFRRMHQVVELEDTASIRGMINKINHLIVVESAQ
ncbi:MAG: 50S ribosomal protein L30 [Zetaproteobacteria bacterium]|nr:50S ribosomal protein L30 [Zetaproteobacteria bacterium]MDQ6952212.1 50S ribosomal protein L30 [Mariprofundaceae bacterium]